MRSTFRMVMGLVSLRDPLQRGRGVVDYALTVLLFTLAILPLMQRSHCTQPDTIRFRHGVLAGAAILSNPSVAVALLVVAAFTSFSSERRSRAVRCLLIYGTGIAVICGPWCWRNYEVLSLNVASA
jgi:4-amino-4-deoxy-L-arabinose transferase-like glycosyltransferase